MGTSTIEFSASRALGPGRPALVVAEIGQNHNGQLKLAEDLVDAAAWAGADAVKFVKRDLGCELSRDAREARYVSPHAFGTTYGEHRAALELPAEAHESLVRRARRRGLLVFGTACDPPSADLLASLEVDAFKVASRDLANHPLLDYLAQFDRPLLLSTGMSGFSEIDGAVETLRGWAARFALLHCTSLYPAGYEDVHLRSLAAMRARYGVPVGFSDHSPGGLLAPVAVALGASVVEKHLTLDRWLKGTDQACSLEPLEFERMVSDIRSVVEALGRDDKPVSPKVAGVRGKLGRSLVTRWAVSAGQRIDEAMLTLKCPGTGLGWSDRHRVVGRIAVRDLAADSLITWDDLLDGELSVSPEPSAMHPASAGHGP